MNAAAPGLSQLIGAQITYQSALHGHPWTTEDVESKFRLVAAGSPDLTGFKIIGDYTARQIQEGETEFEFDKEDLKIHGPFPVATFNSLGLYTGFYYSIGYGPHPGPGSGVDAEGPGSLSYTSSLIIYDGRWKDHFAVFAIYDKIGFMVRETDTNPTAAEKGTLDWGKPAAEPFAGKIGIAYYLNMKAKTTHTVACLGFFVEEDSETIVQRLFDTLEQTASHSSRWWAENERRERERDGKRKRS